MKEISLTQSKVALIDDEDYELVSQYKWFAHHRAKNIFYASSHHYINGKRKSLDMHRLIMNFPDGKEVDHINGNGLDNRRENLRSCTHAENIANQRKTSGTSLYKGVFWRKRAKKWCAQIKVGSQQMHLGYFKDEKDAARAYDRAALTHFGSFARLNFNIGEEN